MAVYELKGRWYMRFMIRKKLYHLAIPEATNKKDAENAEIRTKSDLLQGKYDLAENIGEKPFTELMKVYLEYSKANKLSHASDISRVNHLLNFFKGYQIGNISPFDIEKYKIKRQGEKTKRKTLTANTTINRELEILRKAMNIALQEGWILKNTASTTFVKKLRQDNKQEKVLQPNEEVKLLNLCVKKYAYLRPIFIFLLHTGCRRSECLNLRWENVNLKQKFITLTKTKNGHVRKIPLSETLLAELKDIKDKKISEVYVFCNPKTGKPYTDIKKSFNTLCVAVGINKTGSKMRIHDLRHTFCTRLVQNGVDLRAVQELAGHSSLVMVQRYAHVSTDTKKSAISSLDHFIENHNNIVSIAV